MSVKPKSVETERSRKCDAFRETTLILDTKIKVLAVSHKPFGFSHVATLTCGGVHQCSLDNYKLLCGVC